MKIVKGILWVAIWPVIGIGLAFGYQQYGDVLLQNTPLGEFLPAVSVPAEGGTASSNTIDTSATDAGTDSNAEPEASTPSDESDSDITAVDDEADTSNEAETTTDENAAVADETTAPEDAGDAAPDETMTVDDEAGSSVDDVDTKDDAGDTTTTPETAATTEQVTSEDVSTNVAATTSETTPSETTPSDISAPTEDEPEFEIDQSRAWERLDSTGGGGLTSVAVHPTNPQIAYIAADNSGVFKTENRGDSWVSISSNLGAYRLGFVTLDPLNSEIIYVTAKTDNGHNLTGGETGEIHRSLNDGLSWQFISGQMGFQSSFPSQASIAIPYDATDETKFDTNGNNISDVLVVAAWTGPADPPVGGIWLSSDEGKTFTNVALTEKSMTAIKVFDLDPSFLYAASFDGGIFRSDDIGLTWTSIKGDLPLKSISDIAVHSTDANIIYATCRDCGGDAPSIWMTKDGGESWGDVTNDLADKGIKGFPKIIFDRFDSNTLYVSTLRSVPGGNEGVYKTEDGGETWSQMPARLILPDGRPFHADWRGKQLLLGQAVDGTLFTSGAAAWRYPDGDPNDGVEEWEPATLGIANTKVQTLFVDPENNDVVYQGIADFGPFKSEDQGQSFHRILGHGWPVTVDNYKVEGPYFSNYQYCSMSCSSFCAGSGKIHSGGATAFVTSKQDPEIVYSSFQGGSGSSARGGINKSIDGGATWRPLGFQLEQGLTLNPDTCVPFAVLEMVVDPTDDQVVYAAQQAPTEKAGFVYKSENGGETWQRVFTTTQDIRDMDISIVDPNMVAIATRAGVFQSNEGGSVGSWQNITPPDVKLALDVTFSPHNRDVVVVGTNTRGLFYSQDGGVSWQQNKLAGLQNQVASQDDSQPLDPEIATGFNPDQKMVRRVTVAVFDPIAPDTFYIGSRQISRSGFGVAKITNNGQSWQRLPLAGLDHRNVYSFAVDSGGEYLYAGTFNGAYRFQLR
ncbi:MAG: hypothetical protein AAF629_19510 [Chloroflexota bacterium]